MKRREFLALSGMTAANLAWGASSLPRLGEAEPAKPDFTLRIAPIRLELAPGKVIDTVGYNGTAPGPLLRMPEGKRVTVEVHNDTDVPELVHWHGQFIPSDVDGAEEEGTPFVPAHGRRSYTFSPRPAGSRWYHTHAMAAEHLDQGQYTGQFGFLYVEPKSEPGAYDQEIFLAARHWGPSLAHMGPPDNGWEIGYSACSINDKALGAAEPIRVRQGQRVLFRLLNASATEDVWLALPGHKFRIIALGKSGTHATNGRCRAAGRGRARGCRGGDGQPWGMGPRIGERRRTRQGNGCRRGVRRAIRRAEMGSRPPHSLRLYDLRLLCTGGGAG